jgi:hypothetical protein
VLLHCYIAVFVACGMHLLYKGDKQRIPFQTPRNDPNQNLNLNRLPANFQGAKPEE